MARTYSLVEASKGKGDLEILSALKNCTYLTDHDYGCPS